MLQAYAFLMYIKSKVSWSDIKHFVAFTILAFAGLVFVAVVFLTYAGECYKILVDL